MVAPLETCQILQESPSSVKAHVRYVKAPAPGQVLISHIYEQQDGSKPDNLEHVPTEVTLTDIRGLQAQSFDLLVNGFALVNFVIPADIDWESNDEVTIHVQPPCFCSPCWQHHVASALSFDCNAWTMHYRQVEGWRQVHRVYKVSQEKMKPHEALLMRRSNSDTTPWQPAF